MEFRRVLIRYFFFYVIYTLTIPSTTARKKSDNTKRSDDKQRDIPFQQHQKKRTTMKAVLAVLALLLGVAFGNVDQNPYGALRMQDSWKQEITYDWDELDHAAAFESW
eukprot:607135_1